MEGLDLSTWMGKPPEKEASNEQPEQSAEHAAAAVVNPPENEDVPSDISFSANEEKALSFSDESDTGGDILHDDGTLNKGADRNYHQQVPQDDASSGEQDEYEDEGPPIELFRRRCYIDVPKLSDRIKETYEYLPGHFSVARVLYQRKDNRYGVKLESGEESIVSLITFYSCLSHPYSRKRNFSRLSL